MMKITKLTKNMTPTRIAEMSEKGTRGEKTNVKKKTE